MSLKHDFCWYAERMGSDVDDSDVNVFIDHLSLQDLDVDEVFEGDEVEFNRQMRSCFNEQE